MEQERKVGDMSATQKIVFTFSPAYLLLTALGFWLLPAFDLTLAATIMKVAAVCTLCVGILLLLGVRALRSLKARNQYTGYSCPRCNYTPNARDVAKGESLPCPHCGQPVYSHR